MSGSKWRKVFLRRASNLSIVSILLLGWIYVISLLLIDKPESDADENVSDQYRSFIAVDNVPPVIAGEVNEIQGKFELQNNTNEPISVLDVNKSCTCTTALINDKPATKGLVIASGESASLTVSMNIKGRSGSVSADCLVKNSAGLNWNFRVTGHVYRNLEFSAKHLNLGRVATGEHKSAEVTIHTYSRDSSPPIPILRTDNKDLAFSIIHHQTTDVVPGDIFERTTRVRLEVTGAKVTGASNARLIAQIPSEGKSKESFYVNWRTTGPYLTTPRIVFFGTVPNASPSSPRSEKVTVRRYDDQLFSIVSTKCSDLPVAVSVEKSNAAEEHELLLELDPAELQPGFSTGEVVVKTTLSDFPQFTIQVSAVKTLATQPSHELHSRVDAPP